MKLIFLLLWFSALRLSAAESISPTSMIGSTNIVVLSETNLIAEFRVLSRTNGSYVPTQRDIIVWANNGTNCIVSFSIDAAVRNAIILNDAPKTLWKDTLDERLEIAQHRIDKITKDNLFLIQETKTLESMHRQYEIELGEKIAITDTELACYRKALRIRNETEALKKYIDELKLVNAEKYFQETHHPAIVTAQYTGVMSGDKPIWKVLKD